MWGDATATAASAERCVRSRFLPHTCPPAATPAASWPCPQAGRGRLLSCATSRGTTCTSCGECRRMAVAPHEAHTHPVAATAGLRGPVLRRRGPVMSTLCPLSRPPARCCAASRTPSRTPDSQPASLPPRAVLHGAVPCRAAQVCVFEGAQPAADGAVSPGGAQVPGRGADPGLHEGGPTGGGGPPLFEIRKGGGGGALAALWAGGRHGEGLDNARGKGGAM